MCPDSTSPPLPASASGPAESRDPNTGEVWATYAAASASDIAEAVARGRDAFLSWSARDLDSRLALLSRLADVLFARREEVARTISRENGKPMVEALATEVATTLDILRYYVRVAPRVLAAHDTRSASLALWRKRITIEREAYGVIAVIAPWNYPFMLPAGIVAPAIVAGNSVVLKPSEFTPSSARLLAELFADAGLPDGVLQVAHGGGATGAALVAADVDKVFFTGSVATGRRVAHACAERLIPCVLELGGSDPALVLADADIEHAASGILWGRFSNAGQTCVAPKRVLVHGSVYDAFTTALERRVRALRVSAGDSERDLGALVRPAQLEALVAQRDEALARGCRGIVAEGMPDAEGLDGIFAPTLVLDPPREARVMREETFGPLLPVRRVEDDEEMVALANDSAFGLSASVWSRDRGHARQIAARLQAGTVVINDVALVAGVAEVPHGGVKSSGTGRAHGVAGLEECVRTRTIVDDLFPSWRQPWWFGYGPSAWQRMNGYLRLAHGRNVMERLSGVRETVALLFRPERPL